jgi:hypothetical protein
MFKDPRDRTHTLIEEWGFFGNVDYHWAEYPNDTFKTSTKQIQIDILYYFIT